MNKWLIIAIVLFIPFTYAQLGYNNPNLPRVTPPTISITSTSSSGGNVTSVTSSTNCITVNPTTEDVVLTFNSSCSGNSINPFDQVLNTTSNVTFDYITSTGNVTSSKWFNGLFNWTTSSFLTFNGAFLDLASTTKQWLYNQTTAVFTMPLLNNTIADYGNRVGFNSTFNSTYATFSYNQTIIQSASGVSPYINTSINADKGLVIQFNETKLNQTIDNRGVAVGFNSTFNETYNIWAYNQTFNNNTGSVNRSNCWQNDCSGFRNPFNQVLNTSSTAFFDGVVIAKAGLGDYIVFTLSGLPVGKVTSELARLEIQALLNLDFTFSNDDRTALFQILDNGGFLINGTKGTTFKTNNNNDFIINGTAVVSNRYTSINASLNVTGNTCLSNGRCLNYTAGLKNSLPIYNKTLLYWNNNTLDWQQLTSPVGDVFLGHCDATGLSWRSASASCPI